MSKSFYITTTLPYVNAPLHMGHALEFIRADVIARYKKLSGYDVFFNTGTDEHGTKIYEKAQSLGLDPQTFVDQNFANFRESIKIFGLDESILHFIRTTDEAHVKKAQEFWQKVYDNGFIEKRNYSAKYCVGCESEKTESELNDRGFCPDHDGIELKIINEENYFFKYSLFGEKLLKFYNNNPHFVIPDFRFNEIKAFVERGLQDFSISRMKEKMPWGIPVPGDDTQVMYVWFDALTNYINTLDVDEFDKFWVNGTPTQYCGKDNLRFQSAMWQAMLIAYFGDDKYCSHQIVINGFITADGGVKMSKTLGNVVDPKEIVAEYGTDALRYFLLAECSSFEDSPFTMERFKEAYNAKLANGVGNLTSRIMTLSEKYIDGAIVELIVNDAQTKSLNKFITDELNNFDINIVCKMIWNGISTLDKRLSDEEVFKVIKTDIEKGKEILRDYLDKLANIAHELEPVLPDTSKKIFEIMKANKKPETPLFLRKD